MKKEDLIKLKKQINELNECEKKLRIQYLKELSSSILYGPLTGYASIDRPWLKYYNDDSIKALNDYVLKDESMYESLYEYAKDHLDDVAIEYLGNEITYCEFLSQIKETAKSLKSINVNEKDIVLILLPNCPEARYLIYACSLIGAIPNPIMPTINTEDLNNIIKNTKSNKIFMMNSILNKHERVLNENNIETNNIITIHPLRSSKGIYQIIYLMTENDDKFSKFILNGKYQDIPKIKTKGTDIAVISQTGGTTGLTSKGVVITNQNVYASNYQLSHGGFDFSKGDSLLDILLPSISYGLAFEHLTLCNGIKNYMIPILVKKQINKYISKYKPNHIMMGPIHFEFIVRDKFKRKWTFIKNIVSGGDMMSIELEESANKKLKENKSLVNLEQGYGETECFGACACNHSEFIKTGSVGLPHLLTTMAVFGIDENLEDYTTDIELTFGKKGELCISSPVVMKEYLNNKKESDLVLKKHRDGTVWLHTGDVGYISEDGYVYITDRIKDLIFRNGFKVSPKKISNIIMEKFSYCINTVITLGVPDKIERNVPVVFIKFKEDIDMNTEFEKIKEFINTKFQGIESVKEIVIIDNIPRTSVGKINKQKIKEEYLDSKKVKKLIKN